MGKERERDGKQIGREEREGMIMSCTPDTSSCFYGDQGANGVALLRTVLLTADKRVERERERAVCVCVCEGVCLFI